MTGTYTFKVTFNDVGGEGLEEKPIERTVTIDMGKGESTGTITGIPVGTRYTIEEVKTDDSRLQSVTVPKGQSAQVIYNTMVEGVIVASEKPNDPTNLKVTAIFTNTKRKLINIEFDKLWKDAMVRSLVQRTSRTRFTSSSSAKTVLRMPNGMLLTTRPRAANMLRFAIQITAGCIPLTTWISTRLAAVRIITIFTALWKVRWRMTNLNR